MKCQLCHRDVRLLKKSHIIPDFMYKGLFDEKHFMAKLNLTKMEVVSSIPTGIYDKNILCAECDNEIIGSYESYASKILCNRNISNRLRPKYQVFKEDRGASKITVENIDYNKFKLFLLSILWRGHISKNSFFDQIDLGNYAEQIRQFILNRNAGDELDFESVIIIYDKSFIPSRALVPSRKFRLEGNICYIIHIQGVSIIYKVTRGNQLEYFEIGKLRKSNKTTFYTLRGEIAKSFFNKTTGVHF